MYKDKYFTSIAKSSYERCRWARFSFYHSLFSPHGLVSYNKMITSQRCWFERGALKGRDGFNDNSCVFFHLQLLNVVKNFVFHYIEWDLTNNSSILNKSKLVLSSWYGFLIEIKEQEGEIKSSKPCITHFESIYQAECRVIAMDWFRPTRHPPRRDLLGKRYPISYIWIK